MENEARRGVFSIKGCLVVTAILILLAAIAVPAISSARDAARRNQCACKLKQVGLALQNYHSAFNKFPALTHQGNAHGSANIWDTAPGATFTPDSPAPNGYTQSPACAAGYSWIVMILPYLGEQDDRVLYDFIVQQSEAFTYEAFSGKGPVTDGYGGMRFFMSTAIVFHFSTASVDEVSCPSYPGEFISTACNGTANPPVTIEAYAQFFDANLPNYGVRITNYFALSATHLACMGLAPDDAGTDSAEPPNGVIVPGDGLSMKSVLDGAAKTLVVCETKEPAVNSWYDGTVCWTVGTNPNASSQPTWTRTAVAVNGGGSRNGNWVFPQGTKDARSLNYGPGKNRKHLFTPSGTTPAQTQPVSWGPSSDHAGGVVMHLACDGSVHALTEDIDPELYLSLITRAGGESTAIPGAD